jgi:hypothetical protein
MICGQRQMLQGNKRFLTEESLCNYNSLGHTLSGLEPSPQTLCGNVNFILSRASSTARLASLNINWPIHICLYAFEPPAWKKSVDTRYPHSALTEKCAH